MNTQLRDATFVVCALVSGVLNYFGLSEMAPDGDITSQGLFALTGLAVSMALILFWNYAFSVVPELRSGKRRAGSWATIALGIVLIIGISTWWNVVGIAKDEITRLNATAVETQASQGWTTAINSSGKYLSYRPGVAAFTSDIGAVIAAEISGGTSGQDGAGPISETMGQVKNRLNNLLNEIDQASERLMTLRTKGDTCLVGLRIAVASGNTAGIAKQVACANSAISDLGNLNVAGTIERGLNTLTDGIVLPAAVRTDRQRAILNGFFTDTQTRADSIAATMKDRAQPVIEPLSAEMPNLLLGVLLHWKSLIPVIATALALDLLPLVLLALTVLMKDDLKDQKKVRTNWTAEEMQEAFKLMSQLQDYGKSEPDLPPPFVDLPEGDWHEDVPSEK